MIERWLEALVATPGLTSVTGEDARRVHVDESLAALDAIRQFDGPIVDVGSGGGAPGIPLAALQTERWDDAGGSTLRWSFPVTVGKLVQVRLYFAETYINSGNVASVGPRVFDVEAFVQLNWRR